VKVKARSIGMAGELRVMSELLLRGFNPAKSYLDNGVDLILENGCKIQIKTSHKNLSAEPKREHARYQYHFNLQNWKTKKFCASNVDIVILWAIDDNIFFVIPALDIAGISALSFVPSYKTQKMRKYINNWEILREL